MPKSHAENAEKVQAKRCFVSMFSADKDLVYNFTMPKLRKGCEDNSVQYKLFAWNEKTGAAQGFIEFEGTVWTNVLKDRLTELGACTVIVETFQINDGNYSAASALNNVRRNDKKEGFVMVEHGTCNPKLLAKANGIIAMEKKKYCIVCGANQDDVEEFDVVKKRRLMNAAGAEECDDECPETHAYFKQFEEEVVCALMKSMTRIHEDEYLNRVRESLEADLEDCSNAKPTGGVYLTKSDALPNLIKIGATRRSDPALRLYELSRCVPKPFQLLEWFPNGKPFALEHKIHKHFASRRIRETGAGTEFFEIDDKDIDTMMATLHLKLCLAVA
jgi:hypothetical protein